MNTEMFMPSIIIHCVLAPLVLSFICIHPSSECLTTVPSEKSEGGSLSEEIYPWQAALPPIPKLVMSTTAWTEYQTENHSSIDS